MITAKGVAKTVDQGWVWEHDELAPHQLVVLRAFYKRTVREGLEHFSSDNFRLWGYDVNYLRNSAEIGLVFGFVKRMGYVRQVGEVKSVIVSNHRRKVDLLEWTSLGRAVLNR